jgi:hypothetical protein
MKCFSALLSLVLLSAFATSANAETTVHCNGEDWKEAPMIGQDSLQGTLVGECDLTGAKPARIEHVAKSFVRNAGTPTQVHIVNRGPIPEIYNNQNSLQYDVTEVGSGLLGLTVHFIDHITSDQVHSASLIMLSQDTKGSMMTKYTKRLDVSVEVSSTPEPAHYRLKMSVFMEIARFTKKDGVFQYSVNRIAHDQFKTRLEKALPELKAALDSSSL